MNHNYQMIKPDTNLGFQKQADIFFFFLRTLIFSEDIYQMVIYSGQNLENNIHQHVTGFINSGIIM